MRRLPCHSVMSQTLGLSLPVAITVLLLLAASALRAETPYTATGWIASVPVPGVWCTNASGQIGMRGNAHLARVESSDPRLTGRRTIFVNGDMQADGSALIHGAACQEVGTWDAAGTNFTATGGMWETSHRGTMGADGSMQLHIVGYGWGGSIDGLRIEETLTRTNGPILAPTIPYLYTGTIKPPPLNTTELVSDFGGPFTYPKYGSGTCFNSNGQFHAVGNFPPTVSDTFLLGQQCATAWNVTNLTTREWRADLVSLDDTATNMAQLAVSAYIAPGYSFFKGRDFAFLLKWSSQNDYSVLWCDKTPVPLPHANVILAVALTREAPDVVITSRVLDKADPNKVLFAHSCRDTPASDPSLTTAQFQALTGVRIGSLYPDAAEPPPTLVGVLLGLRQYTDGHQPVPTAVFDNLEMRTSEIPPLGIEPAVRVSWPALSTLKLAIEAAPTVQGPWQPVQDATIPGMNQITVPTSGLMHVFRAVQSP